MLPPHHALATAILAVPLLRGGWTRWQLCGLFTGGVLIDVDHYLSYVWHTGDVDITRAYRFHRRGYRSPFTGRIHPRWPSLGIQPYREFHSFASMGVVVTMGLVVPKYRSFLWGTAVGMVFHRALDELTGWVHVAQAPPSAPDPDPG